MRHAVIMAGGSGTRLWPLSRRERPKQLLKLFGGKSLLQHARERLRGLFEPANIWVITSAAYLDAVAEALPDIPRGNLVGEPMGRDTANAIGLAAHLLARRDADATMAVFTADHLIRPQDVFAETIRRGLVAAEQHTDALITFGITPTEAHTGYGYVHVGAAVGEAFEVRAFKEKPSTEVARGYLESGEYLWNSGMFVWRVAAILAELERCLPENHHLLAELAGRWDQTAAQEQAAAFAQLARISIDYGVMEKARRVLTVPMECEWIDVGSWAAVAAASERDAHGNATVAPQAVVVDGENNVLVSEDNHLLAVLGVRDLVVVHSGDATLVCSRDQVQRVKELVDLCRQRFGERYT